MTTAPDDPPPLPTHWPDGQPINPWADPWNNPVDDKIREVARMLRPPHPDSDPYPDGVHLDDGTFCYHTPIRPDPDPDGAYRCAEARRIITRWLLP
jgi:hypothetical protein